MKGLKKLGLGVAALGAALAAAAFVAGTVLAVSGSISLSNGSAAPGGSSTVELSANVPAPGLGAWTVDVSYDSSVVSVTTCEPGPGGVCNPAFAADTIRITGASANGIRGNTVLGTITFTCADAEDTSPLTMSLDVFADATIGNPTDITETVHNGTFACAVAPTAAPPAATATPGPVLPNTGTGGGDSSSTNWLLIALVGAGLFGLTSLTAFRLSARRS